MADVDNKGCLIALGFFLIVCGLGGLNSGIKGRKAVPLDDLEKNATYTLRTTTTRSGEAISVKDTNQTTAELEKRFRFHWTWWPKLSIGVLVGGLVLVVFAFRKNVFRFLKRNEVKGASPRALREGDKETLGPHLPSSIRGHDIHSRVAQEDFLKGEADRDVREKPPPDGENNDKDDADD